MLVNLNADQWQLYTASMDCDAAAVTLNEIASSAIVQARTSVFNGMTVTEAIRNALTDAYNKMYPLRNFGAYDSEPTYQMDYEVCKALGIRTMDI